MGKTNYSADVKWAVVKERKLENSQTKRLWGSMGRREKPQEVAAPNGNELYLATILDLYKGI